MAREAESVETVVSLENRAMAGLKNLLIHGPVEIAEQANAQLRHARLEGNDFSIEAIAVVAGALDRVDIDEIRLVHRHAPGEFRPGADREYR